MDRLPLRDPSPKEIDYGVEEPLLNTVERTEMAALPFEAGLRVAASVFDEEGKPLAEENLGPWFQMVGSKRRRLDKSFLQQTCSDTKLLDLNDDVLCIILVQLIGQEHPKVLLPRQLESFQQAYPLVNSSARIQEVFLTRICSRIQTIDAVYPLDICDECRNVPSYLSPDTIAILCTNAGESLQVLKLPSFKVIGERDRQQQQAHLIRTRKMISAFANNCLQLKEISFQDGGSVDLCLAKALFTKNPGLKKLQIDIPGKDLLSALSKSECTIVDLKLIRAQSDILGSLKDFLSLRGNSVRNLEVSICLPLDVDFKSTRLNRARCSRREKTFIEGLETLTRTGRMDSLRSVSLRPEKRAGWFRDFIKRFQMICQANLIIGYPGTLYPAAVNPAAEAPMPMLQFLSLDQLMECYTPAHVNEYINRLHKPHTISLIRSSFTYSYGIWIGGDLEEIVKTVIAARGEHVRSLHFTPPVPHHMIDIFGKTARSIVRILDEKCGNVDRIVELRLPVNTLPYLPLTSMCEGFLSRLTNLQQLHLTRPKLQREVSPDVALSIPRFLRDIMKICPNLRCIYIAQEENTELFANVACDLLVLINKHAMRAMDMFEMNYPQIDASSIRRQISKWTEHR